MHFEVLVEDQSGGKALEILLPKMIDHQHTFKIHTYNGIGRIPKKSSGKFDPKKRSLLNQLPQLLRGYGKTFSDYPNDCPAAVIVVCDLDDKCLKAFHKELLTVLNACNPKPETRFCLAIEEGEAWFLGDIAAIKQAYPNAKEAVLKGYKNDAICGTWERLADAVFSGGAKALVKQRATGTEKFAWAEKITPHMNVDNNCSESFCYFRDKVRELAGSV
ncbi:MAG: DUF4276 family protein [Gammaproteobacteria bacterium]|nr:DUF4276 family protein [Gammaproteobacteria bacterium]